jgi:hypothetical protein
MTVCVHKPTKEDYKMNISSVVYYTSTEFYKVDKITHCIKKKKIITYTFGTYLDLS